jgi:hypothetical protein
MDNPLPASGGPPAADTSGMTLQGALVLQQASHILEPLVRLLLQHGVTYPQLAETLKTVYVDAAQSGMERSPARVTDSELAVRTGIHRKDIKRLRGNVTKRASGDAEDAPQSLTSTVFTRWLTDPVYCNEIGKPMPLSRNGDAVTNFDALVKTVSKDVHPRTVLNELSRLDLVDIEGETVRLKVSSFVPNADFTQMLNYLGANLHDHAAAAVQNILGNGPRLLEQSIYSDAVDARSVDELAELARKVWAHVMKRVVPQVARYEPGEQGTDTGKAPNQYARIRLGMYFYADDKPADNNQ